MKDRKRPKSWHRHQEARLFTRVNLPETDSKPTTWAEPVPVARNGSGKKKPKRK